MKTAIAEVNETKSWFFENKIGKSLARKREQTQIYETRHEKEKITNDNAEIERIVRDYYRQLYGNEMDNLEEMDKFLEKYKFQD